MPAFKLGARSKRELNGVHPDLVGVVKRALELTPVDFSVHDGKRTEAEQREFVRRGVSKTMKSRHLTGHAVDLVPFINGQLRWEWPPIYKIAEAVRQAAQEQGVPIEWGGVWDRRWDKAEGKPEAEVESYVARRRKKGLKAFIDGPHFQLPKRSHPA